LLLDSARLRTIRPVPGARTAKQRRAGSDLTEPKRHRIFSLQQAVTVTPSYFELNYSVTTR